MNEEPIECAMRNTATAMTKTFRDSTYVAQSGSTDATGVSLRTTLVVRTYVHVAWYWLSIPVLVWILAVAVWFGAAIATWRHKVPMWRNNPLPLLFLYDGGEKASVSEQGRTGESSGAYTARAGTIAARLRLGPGGARLE